MKNIIVVGAGILGASTAYHLAKAGANVTIVDRQDKGQATDAAAGIVCPWISQRRNKAWYTLVKNGAKYYPDLIKELEAAGEKETGYKQVGALSLHTDSKKLEKMVERTLKRREDAPEIGEVTILSQKETKDLLPFLSEQYQSVHISGGARVNGRALRDALVRCAQKLGVRIEYGDAKLIFDSNKIAGVKLTNKILEAEKVIVTGGAWSSELFSPLGVNFLVKPQKAQIVHLEIENHHTDDWPVVMPPNNQYMLAFEDGKIVVGATHEDEAGFDTNVTAGGVNEILGKALEVAPGLANSKMVETRVGFRPFTPDFLPVIGAIPNFEGLFTANGLGASGLTSGPYLGAELAKLVLGQQTELDLSQYDINGAIE